MVVITSDALCNIIIHCLIVSQLWFTLIHLKTMDRIESKKKIIKKIKLLRHPQNVISLPNHYFIVLKYDFVTTKYEILFCGNKTNYFHTLNFHFNTSKNVFTKRKISF